MHCPIEAMKGHRMRRTHERFVNDDVCALDQLLVRKFATVCLSVSTEFRYFAVPRARGISIHELFFVQVPDGVAFFVGFRCSLRAAPDPTVMGFYSFSLRQNSVSNPSVFLISGAFSARVRTRYETFTVSSATAKYGLWLRRIFLRIRYFHVANSN